MMRSGSLAGLTGVALLRDPALNKGTAFTDVERDKLACAACCRRTWPTRRNRSVASSRTSASCASR